MKRSKMARNHADLPDAGRVPHAEIDELMQTMRRRPVEITGARDDTEAALANLLAALDKLGLIKDSTTAS